MKIEEEHFTDLYNPFKKICKHYGLPHPVEAEMMLFCHNLLLPRLYELAGLAGMDPRDYAKENIITIAKELDTLLENNETVIKLQNTKKEFYKKQDDLITFTSASQVH